MTLLSQFETLTCKTKMSKIRCNKKASKEPNILPGSGSVEHTHQCQINKMALLIPQQSLS